MQHCSLALAATACLFVRFYPCEDRFKTSHLKQHCATLSYFTEKMLSGFHADVLRAHRAELETKKLFQFSFLVLRSKLE